MGIFDFLKTMELGFIIGYIISGGFFLWLFWDDIKYSFLKGIFWFIISTVFLGSIMGVIINSYIPEKPKVYIDNQYTKNLDVYVSKNNNNLKFKTTISSFNGEFVKFNKGDVKIVMMSKDQKKIDEINVELDYNKVYVLNPLNLSMYCIGKVHYSKISYRFGDSGESNEKVINKKFFCIEDDIDYWLTSPPESITITTNNNYGIGSTDRTYLKRNSCN
tara:strand:- start:147 stop:800 length:654 start_codon:yes stop_codon:yes gene_type:complete